MKSDIALEFKLSQAAIRSIIVPRTENNQYLKSSYKGSGTLVSEKWNIKIYTSGSVVCNDFDTLNDILENKLKNPDSTLKLLQIDDSGWGFPLCGVMVGVCDDTTILTDVVPVSFFQKEFKSKKYLTDYASRGLKLVVKFKASPKTHRIEICTGFINSKLKQALRKKGYDVRVTEIKGMLQDQLELSFKKHVYEETGLDLAYDPKAIGKNNVPKVYKEVLKIGLEKVPHLLKSGWSSMEKLNFV